MAEGSECEQGTICVGSNMSKRCVKPLEEGGSCGIDAFAVCQKELSCRGNVCRKPLVKNGESCLEEGSECETGTTCSRDNLSKAVCATTGRR